MNKSTQSGGVGCLGTIGIVFVILKLLNLINWSWWLVLLPFYGTLALILFFAILFAIFG